MSRLGFVLLFSSFLSLVRAVFASGCAAVGVVVWLPSARSIGGLSFDVPWSIEG